jgi:hypothetical protein
MGPCVPPLRRRHTNHTEVAFQICFNLASFARQEISQAKEKGRSMTGPS